MVEWQLKRENTNSRRNNCSFFKSYNTYSIWIALGSKLWPRGLRRELQHLSTPWNKDLLDKLACFQPVKKFPAFYGTRIFFTAIISARHLALSWARSIQFMLPHLTSWWYILILSSQLRLCLPSGLFLSGFPHQNLYASLLSPIHATCPDNLILLDVIIRKIFGKEYRSLSSSFYSFLHSPGNSSLLGPNILLSILFSKTLSLRSSLNVSDHVSHPHKITGKFSSSAYLNLYIFC